MSNLSRQHLFEGKSSANSSSRRSGWRKRAPYYAAIGLLVILTLAYIDGGEQPIRPITQAVTMLDVAAESG